MLTGHLLSLSVIADSKKLVGQSSGEKSDCSSTFGVGVGCFVTDHAQRENGKNSYARGPYASKPMFATFYPSHAYTLRRSGESRQGMSVFYQF
jgi:hypothetical protein